MRYWARFRWAAAVALLVAASPTRAHALNMPSPFVQEVLIKSILVTLNDAVASDNFTVLHAKISKPFRDQFPPEKLRNVFKDLVEKHAVFDAIVRQAGALPAQVLVIEPLGSHLLLTVEIGGELLKVVTRVDFPVNQGDTVYLVLETGKIRWYDPESGLPVAM